MRSQGIPDEQALRDRLAARLQQEKYVESRIAPLVKVTDEEARQWFDENHEHLAIPERVEARHVFLPTLERDAAEAQQTLTAALASLTDKSKDFATLARELSEDPTTKEQGGALGWLTRERLPADLAAPLFALPLNQPTLVRSKLGWHLLEVTGRKPAEPRTFDQAKPEILSALEAIKRRRATTEFRTELRKLEARNVVIFPDMIDDPAAP
jgi:parvulin-like peptidyl-prolyl isomerase